MQVGITATLSADGSFRTMARINNSLIREHHKLGMKTIHQLAVATAGQIGSTHAIVEQGIPSEQHTIPEQTNTTRGMTRGMKNPKMQVAQVYTISTLK